MVAKPLCPLYKNIIKPLDRARYPELRYIICTKGILIILKIFLRDKDIAILFQTDFIVFLVFFFCKMRKFAVKFNRFK